MQAPTFVQFFFFFLCTGNTHWLFCSVARGDPWSSLAGAKGVEQGVGGGYGIFIYCMVHMVQLMMQRAVQ